jgi:MFS family permease
MNSVCSDTDTRRARRNAIRDSAIGYATDDFDLLVTATLFGAIIGGFTFGWLSDRLGRVRVLVWTIVLFAVFTGLCAPARAARTSGVPDGDHIIAIAISTDETIPMAITMKLKNRSAEPIAPPPCVGSWRIA